MISHPNDVSRLPMNSRVWIFQSSKPIDGSMAERLSRELSDFIMDWAAHGKQLFAAFEIRYERFIIIAVDERQAAASGCSIDSMMRRMQALDMHYNLDLLNRMKVAYRMDSDILECSLNDFSKMLEKGEVDKNTIVFNNLVQQLADLDHSWECTVAESWHVNLLR